MSLIISVPNNWDSKDDETKYYHLSEVKMEGILHYQEIRPLTPKRHVHNNKNRNNNEVNYDNDYRHNNREKDYIRNNLDNRSSYKLGGIDKDMIIKIYSGDVQIPNTTYHITYYLGNFNFNIEKYDEVIEWLFPTEYIGFDEKTKDKYLKMVEKGCDVALSSPNHKKAIELLFRIRGSVNKICPDLKENVSEIDNILTQIQNQDNNNDINPAEIRKEDIINFYIGRMSIPSTHCDINYYIERFQFKISNYDEVIRWLFPTEYIDRNDFNNNKMKENYKRMVEKAIYNIDNSSDVDKILELQKRLKESIKVINFSLKELLKSL